MRWVHGNSASRPEPGAPHKSPRAFTLLEMLLAAAVTVLMVTFLHVIFSSITGTVTLGVATSDLIRASADYTVQVRNDSEAMVGPLGGGFLVIFQKRIDNVSLRENDPATDSFRADQVMWVRTIGGSDPPFPATPGSPDSYVEAPTDATHGRVWYGHVLRTDENGTSATDLGQPGPNRCAVDWVLGRQLLFFDKDPASVVHIDTSNTYPGWNVTGYTSIPSAPNDAWHKGLSDVFDMDLPAIQTYFDGDPLLGITGVGYPAGPYRLLFGDQRLWCNPRHPEGVEVDTWRVAQMHSYYIAHVSDFQVDFAGNYDNLTGIDVNPIDNAIKWYSHFYNNSVDGNWSGGAYEESEPVTFRPPEVPVDLTGFIPLDPTSLYSRAIYQKGALPNADGAFTFRPTGIDWPQMIRLRYRVHDPEGRLTDRDGLAGKLFERVVDVTVQ